MSQRTMKESADTDMKEIARRAKLAVEKKRETGRYPPDLQEKLRVSSEDIVSVDASKGDDLTVNLELMKTRAILYSDLPLKSYRRFVGPLVGVIKKVIKSLISWYTEPLYNQVTIFNISAVKTVDKLTKELDEANRKISRLENRLSERDK